ncbi:MAG TPA: ACT domain-containing protein [Nocardioidaceae bacterium]|nr:ACT domain-containing protein [Nocardioidaceae bacterium]
MSHLLRIRLPDVPGTLGAVATAIGAVGANIEAIEIVEHGADGTAVDDVFVDLTPGLLPDVVISSVQQIAGVQVLWVSRYAAGGNLSLDLEAVEAITEEPARAIGRLTELVPRAFRADWALVADASDGVVSRVEWTPGAPDLPDEALAWFPLDRAARLEPGAEWAGWSEIEVGATPLGSPTRAIVFGRYGGPEILDSELARLNHLAALTVSIAAAPIR